MALPEGLGGAASSVSNGTFSESTSMITRDMIMKALDTIQDPMQKVLFPSLLKA